MRAKEHIMFEKPNDQQTATPLGAEADASQQAATATTPQGKFTKEQIQAAFQADPSLLDGVTAKLNVYGKEVVTRYSDLAGLAQKGMAADRKFEQAAEKEADLVRREAELAERMKPFQQIAEIAGQRQTAPQDTPPPIMTLQDPDDILSSPAIAVTAIRDLYQQVEALKREKEQLGQEMKTQVADASARADRALAQHQERISLEETFKAAREADPSFTATVVGIDANGKPIVDFGDDPYVTNVALSLKYSDAGKVPSSILDGKTGQELTLPQVVQHVKAHMKKRVEAYARQEQERVERERRTAVGGQAGAGSMPAFELPKELQASPTDSKEAALAKQQKVRQLVLQEARAAGIQF